MPFALLTIGLLLVVSGIRNTTGQLSAQVAKDFSGSNSFLYWLAGLGAVGALGYVQELRTFSRLLLALIIVVMALSNKGFFAQFQAAIANAQAPAPATTNAATGTTQGSTTPAPSSSASTTHAPGLFEVNPGNDFNYLMQQFGLTVPGSGAGTAAVPGPSGQGTGALDVGP